MQRQPPNYMARLLVVLVMGWKMLLNRGPPLWSADWHVRERFVCWKGKAGSKDLEDSIKGHTWTTLHSWIVSFLVDSNTVTGTLPVRHSLSFIT
jgi:hypothetical protein